MNSDFIKKNIIVDASIGVKWFSSENEKKVELAIQLREKHFTGKIELHAPDLFIFEVLNSLVYKNKFNMSEINNIYDSLKLLYLKIIIPDDNLIKNAVSLSVNLKLSYYDSVYVALAQKMGAPFITEDKKILSHADEYKFIKNLDYVQDIKIRYDDYLIGLKNLKDINE